MQENTPNKNNICVILYVEDSDAMTYLFQRALEHTGTDIRLFRVADGERAITFLHQRDIYHDAPRPDMVILDLNLPKKSGFEALPLHLKQLGRCVTQRAI
jgi:CheY-like chemotaxis protein